MSDLQNTTSAEDDPLEDIDIKAFYDQLKEITDALSYLNYFTDTIKLLLCLFIIVADIIIIKLILSDTKLKTKTNLFICHYAIWHLIFVSTSTAYFTFVTMTGLVHYVHFFVFMFLFFSTRLALLVIFNMGLGLGLDWLFNFHDPSFGTRCRWFNSYLIYIMYGFAGIEFIVIISTSAMVHYIHGLWMLRLLYFLILLIVFTLNVINYWTKEQKNTIFYGLMLSNVIMLCWLPLVIYNSLKMIFFGSVTIYSILLFTSFIPEWLSLSSSLVVILALVKLDSYFAVKFWNIFRRNKVTGDVESLEANGH